MYPNALRTTLYVYIYRLSRWTTFSQHLGVAQYAKKRRARLLYVKS